MHKFNTSMPNSDLLKTFCVVASAGNITKASVLLARTQSAISLQIKRLEERLDTTLFQRHARGIVLTEDGRRLLPEAEKALHGLENIGRLFQSPLTGRIRVGIPDDYNETILENALAEFSREHEGVEVFVKSGCTAMYPKSIEEDELDIAIYTAGLDTRADAFFEEPTAWVAATDYKVDSSRPVPLAVFDRNCWWRTAASDALDASGREWRTAYLSDSFTSIKAAIRSGFAIGALAKSAVDPGMRLLGAKEGLPSLPPSSLRILRKDDHNTLLVDAMEHALVSAM